MVKRKIIKIDEAKCNGCGICVPACAEGALQIVNGKAKLVKDQYCDGLGACLGECPQGAIFFEEREAEEFDEKAVEEHLLKKETKNKHAHHGHAGCPGARTIDFSDQEQSVGSEAGERPSQLRQWPVQLHLVPPTAPYFKGKDVVLAADCVAYALGDFHKDYLKGKSLAIACPKLDQGQDVYLEKVTAMIDQAEINTLTVMVMQVPCCGGLLNLAKTAATNAKRKIPIKLIMVGIQGEILKDEWLAN